MSFIATENRLPAAMPLPFLTRCGLSTVDGSPRDYRSDEVLWGGCPPTLGGREGWWESQKVKMRLESPGRRWHNAKADGDRAVNSDHG